MAGIKPPPPAVPPPPPPGLGVKAATCRSDVVEELAKVSIAKSDFAEFAEAQAKSEFTDFAEAHYQQAARLEAQAEEMRRRAASLRAQAEQVEGADEDQALRLSAQHEALAAENARLWWMNQMLREDSAKGWLPSDPWAAAQAAEAGLCPGATATLHSLKSAPELNGVSGTIECWHAESGRWVLKLANGEEKYAKPENLVLATSLDMTGADSFYPYNDAGYCDYYPTWGMPLQCGYSGKGWQDHQNGPFQKNKKNVGRVNGKNPAGGNSKHASFSSEASTAVGSTCTSPSDDDADGKPLSDTGPRTTAMMRNIPNNFTREMLLNFLAKHGFGTSCDLMYLPIDFQTEVGIGYAFINLVSEQEFSRFRNYFQGFTDWEVASHKVCEVARSNPLQGLQAHIERFRNSPVMHESVPDMFKPLLMKDGVPIPFPAPTKRIHAPRLRRPSRR